MAKLRIGSRYWLDRSVGQSMAYASIRGNHAADVCVLGGGFTGCVAACLLADAGLSVVLVEAARIGRGSTAASTALLLREPDLDFGTLAGRYGTPRAREVWKSSAESIRGLRRLLGSARVGGAAHTIPAVRWTCDLDKARDMRRDLGRRHRAGIAGRWLTPTALKRITGIDGAGGIISRGQAQIDPYRACVGLAARARRRGVRVYEHSEVRRIVGDRSGVRIELERGGVRAAWAVIATGYATPEFAPLAGRFRMFRTYVIGTPQIAAPARRRMGLGDVMLWDTGDPYHYARWTPDRRLLFGGADEPLKARTSRRRALEQHAARLMRDLVTLYPTLAGLSPDFAWEGLFATTPDGLPYVGTHRRYPRQLFALGYGGNGMTFSHLAATLIVRAVQERTTPDDRFWGFSRFKAHR